MALAEDRSQGQRVSFATEDGVTLFADYAATASTTAEKSPMAILLHMAKSDRSAWSPLLGALRRAGFAALAVDLRGHGESVGPADRKLTERAAAGDTSLFSQMERDITAAYLWLRDQPGVDPARFVLIGAAAGGSLALDYAARDRSVDGVAVLTPGLNHSGIDAVAAVRDYGSRPLLLVCAETDRAPVDQLKVFQPQAQVEICSGVGDAMASQGTGLLSRVRNLDGLLIEFAKQAAGPASRNPVVMSTRGKTYYAPNSNYARHLQPRNLRWLSSASEGDARGLRPPQSERNAGGTSLHPGEAPAAQ